MNQKQAKALRRAIIGDVFHQAWSNGHVFRRLTMYEAKQLNPMKPFATLSVKQDNPRGVYRHLKRRIKRGDFPNKHPATRTRSEAGSREARHELTLALPRSSD